ncbi:hypothetical protein PR048_013321 [Dryococelus australis]|uniref:Uncharacterized protein n=1 Tax=Dryococelus australis TaxID=614101 RepID=A0ABQ9HSP4_9NEOP|nr:hypothetical protein PR048_013321 [Dryococelus australis]
MTKLIKAELVLLYGNIEVKCGFLTTVIFSHQKDHVFQQQLSDLQSTKDMLKKFKNLPLKRNKKRENDFEEKTLSAIHSIQQEKKLQTKKGEVNQDLKNYTKMVKEANAKLGTALSNNVVKVVKIGQTMLEAALKKVEESKSCVDKIRVE